jgi:hypothetical protein
MKFLLAITFAILAVSYVNATCSGSTQIGIVVTQVITGPPELVEAILTPEDQLTAAQQVLLEEKKAAIKADVYIFFFYNCERILCVLCIFSF